MKLLGDKSQGGKEALEQLPLRWWKKNSLQGETSGARGVDVTDFLTHWLYSALIFFPSQLKIPGEQRDCEQGCLSMYLQSQVQGWAWSRLSSNIVLLIHHIPGVWLGNPLHYSCLENPCGQRSLVDYSPGCCKELDTTEWLSTIHHTWDNQRDHDKSRLKAKHFTFLSFKIHSTTLWGVSYCAVIMFT